MAKDYFMTKGEWKTFNKDKKSFDSVKEYRMYCKCGHSLIISPLIERKFCTHCKHWVYRDEAEQEKYDSLMREKEKELKRYKFRKELNKRL